MTGLTLHDFHLQIYGMSELDHTDEDLVLNCSQTSICPLVSVWNSVPLRKAYVWGWV